MDPGDEVYHCTTSVLDLECKGLQRTLAAAMTSIQLVDDAETAHDPKRLAEHYANWYEGIRDAATICGATMHMANRWNQPGDARRTAMMLQRIEERVRDIDDRPQIAGKPITAPEMARRIIERAAGGMAARARERDDEQGATGGQRNSAADTRMTRYWLECAANLPAPKE